MQFQSSRPNVLQTSVTQLPQQQQQQHNTASSLLGLALNAGIGLATGNWAPLANQAIPGLGGLFGGSAGFGGQGGEGDGTGDGGRPTVTANSQDDPSKLDQGGGGDVNNDLSSKSMTPDLGQPLWDQGNTPEEAVQATMMPPQFFDDPYSWFGGNR